MTNLNWNRPCLRNKMISNYSDFDFVNSRKDLPKPVKKPTLEEIKKQKEMEMITNNKRRLGQ